MPEIVSKSAYAKRHGKAASAVSNWISRGKLWGAALTADGRINADEADRQLAMSIDPITRPTAPPKLVLASEEDENETLVSLRIREKRLEISRRERADAIERGDLVSAEAIARRYAAELSDFIAAVEQFVMDLPAQLGLGREGLATVRAAWRAFRQRQADQAEGVKRDAA